MRIFLSLVIALVFHLNIIAQSVKGITPEVPRLIVGITIGQFQFDYINRYYDKLSDNGIKKLITEGTFCKSTYINYMYSVEGVGHTTIATGTTPSNHGIVGKSWYKTLQNEIEHAAYDQKVYTVGGKYESGRYSPVNLTVSTFSDKIKLDNNFKSKVFSVSLQPIPAVFSVGHAADAVYWFDFESGNFISSSYYLDSLPVWVNNFNAKKFPETYLESSWNTAYPIESYTESLADDNKYERGIKKQNTFPYDLARLNKKGLKNTAYGIFEFVPKGDVIAKDFAINLIFEEQLGKDEFTDYLSVNFTTIERLGMLYGPNSVEVEDAVIQLDKELAHFIQFLESEIGKDNVLIFMTSDHGVANIPDYLTDNKITAGYFNQNSAHSLLKSYLNALYDKGNWIKQFEDLQIYLNRSLIEDANLNLAEVQANVAQFMLQFTGVANTVTAATLETTDFSSGTMNKLQNSVNQKRSADVYINLEANWIIKGNGVTDHLSAYSYDSHVPLVFYGWRVRRKTIDEKVYLSDIAAIICNMIGTSPPASSTGNAIQGILK